MRIAIAIFLSLVTMASFAATTNDDFDPCADASKCTIDRRRYVDWNTPEFSKLVQLESYSAWDFGSGTGCTAQYISPNIILSAGHCVHKTSTYSIRRSDNPDTRVQVKLLSHNYGPLQSDPDWALFEVQDPKYYSDNFFRQISQTTQLNKTVRNAGWGNVRVLTDDEIRSVHDTLRVVCDQYPNCLDIVYATPGQYDISDERYYVYHNVKEHRPESKALKMSDNCTITNEWGYPHLFNASCYVHPGNSGGPYYLGDTLYGVVSQEKYSSYNGTRASIGTRPEGFYQIAQNQIRSNPPKANEVIQDSQSGTPQPTPVKQLPKPEQQPTQPSPIEESNTTTPTPDTETQIKEQQKLEQDIQNKKDELNQQLKDIDTATDEDVLDILLGMGELDYLQQQYERTKAREQSLPNRLLGAAGIGATGIGGMMLASSLSEQSADAAAERDMRAYLATFRCDYGAGRNIIGGERNIQLPGGNELIQYTTEYKQIAVNLKNNKAALGMLPGIEAEVVFDSATTGLYDNVSISRTDGAFTSLSRALQDENSASAAAWKKQTQDVQDKTKTGASVAGTGAGASAIANIIINHTQVDATAEKVNAPANTVQ